MIKISCYFTAYVGYKRSGRTVFCIVDNTVVSKTKPSSQALYPIKITYFLYDSLYNSEKIINVFVKKGFHTIGELKTNRIIYLYGVKKKLYGFVIILTENIWILTLCLLKINNIMFCVMKES